MSIVQLADVQKKYTLGKTEVHALRGVTFSIEKGDFACVAGPSGSGKSTILNLIGCIDQPSSGEVIIDGKASQGLSDKALTNLRHETLGFIFQAFNLIPVLNVYENIEFPLLLGKNLGKKRENKEWIEYLIEAVGLADHVKHKSNELSGGQRQRVAIARALVTKPAIVLADEPTANLDSKTGQDILTLMKKMNADLNTTFIFSTHDSTIIELADHTIHLLDGRIVENIKKEAAMEKIS